MKFDKHNLKLTFKDIMKDVKVRKGTSAAVRTSQAHADRTKYSSKDRKDTKKQLRAQVDEAEILTNVRLSDHQKAVLATLTSRDNQNTTVVDIVANIADSSKQNMTNSILELQKLDLVTVNPDKTIAVSPKGQEIMADNNMIDPATQQLTDEGQKYQFMFVQGEEGKTQDDVGQEMAQAAPIEPPQSEPAFGESFKMMRSIAESIKFENELKKFR